jgi:hypothetical protein
LKIQRVPLQGRVLLGDALLSLNRQLVDENVRAA